MKGLLYKDFCLLKGYAKNFVMFIVVFFAISLLNIANEGGSSIITTLSVIVMILVLMMPITVVSVDENAKWNTTALTMPLSRKILVIEKYIFSGIMILIGASLGFAIGVLKVVLNGGSIAEFAIAITALIIAGVIIHSIYYPLIFKLGVEKARIFFMAICFLPMLIGIVANQIKLTEKINFTGVTQFFANNAVVIVIAGALIIIATPVVSILISQKICAKKEY